jgi:signal transduction histidine kinase
VTQNADKTYCQAHETGLPTIAEAGGELAWSSEKLLRLQRLESIAQTAAGIAHDLNNIFMGISGSITLLKPQLNSSVLGPGAINLFTTIEQTVCQGYKLSRQLLEFGGGSEPSRSLVSLGDTVRKSVSFALVGSGIKPFVFVQSDLWPVYANTGQIAQLVCNLVINARHALQNKGHINVLAENMSSDLAKEHGLKAERHVRIVVSDEGQGIDARNMDKIFEPFFTTKQNGTGLGLATARLIVRQHMGRIDVKSKPGVGTVFMVYLPVGDPHRN